MTPKHYFGVMADVKIRNLDAHVVEAFKLRAKAAGRSLEAELRAALALQLVQSRETLLAKLDTLRAGMPLPSPEIDNSEQTLENIRAAMSGKRV